jgi:hypothetical protein
VSEINLEHLRILQLQTRPKKGSYARAHYFTTAPTHIRFIVYFAPQLRVLAAMMTATEGKEDTATIDKKEEPQEHTTDVVAPSLRWKEGECPETDAWWWSRLIFYWMTPLFRRAAYLKKEDEALEQDDLLPVPECDHSSRIGLG